MIRVYIRVYLPGNILVSAMKKMFLGEWGDLLKLMERSFLMLISRIVNLLAY